jgi:hypothetical protein
MEEALDQARDLRVHTANLISDLESLLSRRSADPRLAESYRHLENALYEARDLFASLPPTPPPVAAVAYDEEVRCRPRVPADAE